MDAGRTATVLIAEPSSDAKRHDVCRKLVQRAVVNAADSTGGLLVSTRGGKLVLRFATADQAASAASKIHAAIDALPPVDGNRPGIQIGIHTGPVEAVGMTLSDATINLAVKLAEKAHDGQTVTSQQMAEQLNPAFKGFSKQMLSLQDETRMCELASWHQKGVRPPGWSAMAVMRLTWRDQLVVCSREKDTVTIGRDAGCDFLIDAKYTSRRHCTLRYRDGQFALLDHSSNGTYVAVGDTPETKLRKSGVLLGEQGTIALGQPRMNGSEVVDFCYALVT
jgi:adenylate cyclase